MPDQDFHWTCDRRALKSALDRLKKTLDPRSMIPVLGQLEVAPDPFNGGAVLRVTDLDAHHSVPVPGSCSGDLLMVDFRQLLKIVDALSEGRIEIRADAPAPVEYHEVERIKKDASTGWKPVPYTVTEAKPSPPQMVRGTLGKKSFSLFRWDRTQDGNALPDAPTCPPGYPCVTVELDLAVLLAPVLHSVAADDSRYGLNGAQLEVYPDGSVGAVSTDGHRCVAHRVQLDAKKHDGPLLSLKFCKNLKDVAPGQVTLTWWRPLSCGTDLSSLSTDKSLFVEGSPLYRVHFDLGGDASRTVVRTREKVRIRHGDGTFSDAVQEKVTVIQDKDPRTATCTVRTSPETLASLLASQVSLDDWLDLPNVAVSGDVSHLRALYEEIPQSDVVQVEHPDGTVLTTRCLEGDFPDWRQVVPSKFLREVTVDRKALDDGLKYVLTVASQKTFYVRITVQEGEVHLNVENPDEGNLSDVVPADVCGEISLTREEILETTARRRKSNLPKEDDPQMGAPFTIGQNGQYLRDELKILGGDRVELRFGGAIDTFILRRPGDDSTRCIMAPRRFE